MVDSNSDIRTYRILSCRRPLKLVDVGSELNVPNKLQGRFPIVINVVNEGFWFRKSIQSTTEARKVKQGEKTPFLFRFL